MTFRLEQEHLDRIAQRERDVAEIRATARRHAFEAAHVAATDAAKRLNKEPVVVALEVTVAMLAVGEALASARWANEIPTPEEMEINKNVSLRLENVGLGSSLDEQTHRAALMLGLPMLLRLRKSSNPDASSQSGEIGRADRGWQAVKKWLVRRLS